MEGTKGSAGLAGTALPGLLQARAARREDTERARISMVISDTFHCGPVVQQHQPYFVADGLITGQRPFNLDSDFQDSAGNGRCSEHAEGLEGTEGPAPACGGPGQLVAPRGQGGAEPARG